jgi:hypothetical protein
MAARPPVEAVHGRRRDRPLRGCGGCGLCRWLSPPRSPRARRSTETSEARACSTRARAPGWIWTEGTQDAVDLFATNQEVFRAETRVGFASCGPPRSARSPGSDRGDGGTNRQKARETVNTHPSRGVVSFFAGKEHGDDHSGTQKRPQSLLRLRALARSARLPAQPRTHIGTLLLVQGMSPRGHPALASRAPRGRGGVERAAPFGALPAARVRHVRRDVHAAPTRRPLLHASLHVPPEALQASDRR